MAAEESELGEDGKIDKGRCMFWGNTYDVFILR